MTATAVTFAFAMISERLRETIRARGVKQSWLAGEAGIPEETLSRIITGTTKNPGIETVIKIAAALDTTVGVLLGERGYEITAADRDMAAMMSDWLRRKFDTDAIPRGLEEVPEGANVRRFPSRVIQAAVNTDGDFPPPPIPIDQWKLKDTDRPQSLHARLAPIAADVAAGQPSNPDDDALIPTAQLLNSIREIRDPRVRVIRIAGHSMHPTLRNGWLVLIDPAKSLFQPGKIVMVYIRDEGTTIGMLAKNGESFRIVKRNRDYGGPSEIALHDGEWYPVGTVTRIVDAPVEIE